MLEYRIIERQILIEGKRVALYGIEAVKCVIAVPNISTDKQKVADLIRRCNEGQLATVHLKDVIEDEFYY